MGGLVLFAARSVACFLFSAPLDLVCEAVDWVRSLRIRSIRTTCFILPLPLPDSLGDLVRARAGPQDPWRLLVLRVWVRPWPGGSGMPGPSAGFLFLWGGEIGSG